LHLVETVTGKHPPAQDFTFAIPGTAAAATVVRTVEPRLIGATFVVFVREFASPRTSEDDGDGRAQGLDEHETKGEQAKATRSELHFHFARDDKAELGAIRRASALTEAR
jgi:hypothetical protein